MRFPTKEEVDRLRRRYPAGTKVRLISMEDPRPVPPGTVGEITGVDDAGQIMAVWSTGSTLSLIPGVDSFEIVEGPA